MHARTRLSVRASRNARMAGALGSWPLTTTLRGMRSELRLLLIVVTIALLASTIITSFALLVVATEQGGVRAALASVDPAQSTLDIQALGPNQTVRQTRERADKAIRSVMGDAAPVRGVGFAISDPVAAPGRDATMETVGYFGELDQVRDHATITDGAWAGLTPPGQPVAVTLPRTAAKSLGLKVGSVFRVQASNAPLDVVVAGLYTVRDPRGDYWGRDRLQGRGDVVSFPKEAVTVFVPTHAFGPLLVPAGAMDAAQIPVHSIDIRYAPDFGNTRVDQIAPLADRLATSDQDVPAAMGLAARSIDYSTHLADVLADVSTSLVVTRSTVVVVSLLLLVLSISALTQTARLFSDARAGERRLMRARGASSGQLITLSVFEALAIGLTCAIASPILAELVYSALAAQPAMVASGMPPLAGLTGQVWLVAGGVAAIFVVVLIAPSLRRAELFVDNDQTKGRAPRGSSLLRSGLDLGLVVLAVVAVWQLQSYKTPVNRTSSPTIDILLVAAPAIVLLAGGLVAVRLIPATSRLVQHLGARSRGAVLPLAAWEVGRRSQRATAAVLLLTLALAVGTFGQSFLATWRLSQLDQASFATGAPVRAPAPASIATSQSALLSEGAHGAAQPTLRRTALVAAPGESFLPDEAPSGTGATVLGLTAASRAVIATGRNGEVGGARLERLLRGSKIGPETSVAMPADTTGITARVSLGEASTARAGISVRVRAMIEDANHLISTVDLGTVAYDGLPHLVSGMLPAVARGGAFATPLSLVGFQADVFVSNTVDYQIAKSDVAAALLVGRVGTLSAASATEPVLLQVPANGRWYSKAADNFQGTLTPVKPPRGWQFDLPVTVPADLNQQVVTITVMGWQPVTAVPAVMSADLAKSMNVSGGIPLVVVVPGAHIPIMLEGTVPLVPGSAKTADLVVESVGRTDASAPALVVADQQLLSRAIAQYGVGGTMADEWWVDVAAGQGQTWLDAHPVAHGLEPAHSAEVLARQLEENPLRVGTQAALWLAIVAAAVLAAIGFAVHTSATIRSRRTELAQLRAIGLSRRSLVALIGVESALLSLLGTVLGIGLGALLGWLVGPLIAISPTGAPPVPSVRVDIPVGSIALLAVEVAAVLAVIVVFVAGSQRSADPASILREGGDS